MKIKLLSLAIVSILLSCGTQEVTTKTKKNKSENFVSVIDPISGIDNTKKTYRIDAQDPGVIKLKRGGSLVFEKNSFVDSDGNPIQGEVEILWEEFHSLADIMLSGIPMKYDSAGVANNLESGGMFTFSGSQRGESIQIAKDKKVEVNLASIQDTPCYNFYELDEKTGDWSYETTDSGEPIADLKETKDVSPETVSIEKMADPNLIDVTLNTRKFAELKGLDIVAWRSKRVLTQYDKNVLRARQTKLRLVKTDSLGLTLEAKTHDKKIHQYAVEPYLMKEAIADTKENRSIMNDELAEIADYTADVEAGRVIRSISISNFGTYNWDCIHQFDNPQQVMASFNFPSKVNPEIVSLFLLVPDKNIVIRCNASGDNSFFFDPNERTCLIGILPNNKLVTFSNDGFDEVRAQKSGTLFTFNLKETGIKLQSSSDITNYMNTLI